MPVERIKGAAENAGEIVEDIPGHAIAQTGPGLYRRRHLQEFVAEAAHFRCCRRKGGEAVYTAFFHRHPVGAKITFFEDMDGDPACAGEFHRRAMIGPAVSEQDQTRDGLLVKASLQIVLPAREATAVSGGAAAPEQPIAEIEIDLPDPVAAGLQGCAEAREERRGRTLQEKNMTV